MCGVVYACADAVWINPTRVRLAQPVRLTLTLTFTFTLTLTLTPTLTLKLPLPS